MPAHLATRRQFTFAMASSLVACATSPRSGPPPVAPAAPTPTSVEAANHDATRAADPAPPQTIAGALMALLTALHKDHLSADDLAKLEKPIGQLAEASAKLRAFPLANSAEPHGGLIGNPGDVR